ncbi:hypothetical protein TNCV_4241871 [Trichonephila clavipes]|nr:hypothetical protein TNCV_4241871 [Trichonephila clavipes]
MAQMHPLNEVSKRFLSIGSVGKQSDQERRRATTVSEGRFQLLLTRLDFLLGFQAALGTRIIRYTAAQRLNEFGTHAAIEVWSRPKLTGIVRGEAFLHVLRRRPIGCPDSGKRIMPNVMDMIESNID